MTARRDRARPPTALARRERTALARLARAAAVAGLLASLFSGVVALPVAAPAGLPAFPPGIGGPSAVRGANGVDVQGSTTYTVAPDEQVVKVSAVLTIRNITPPTTTATEIRRFYFSSYTLGIHAQAENVTAIHDDRQLPVATALREPEAAEDYLEVRVTFHRLLYYGETYALRLDYELPDAGPRSEGRVRVGQAFAGLYGYAFGEEQAEVRIVFPEGFEIVTRQGHLLAPSAGPDGSMVLAATGIGVPADWWAYVGAERTSALRTRAFSLELDGERHRIEVQSWPEDQHWGRIVRDRLTRGLPVMGSLIGLPWPIEGPVQVSEVFTPLLGGYAGIFYESTDEIRITEAANELIVLHEASHAWFDGDMLAGRWINEGLADEYAARTLADLSARAYRPDDVDRTDSVAFPLNAWPGPGTVSDATSEAREAYGYNASWALIRDLIDEIGEEEMREVLAAAQARKIAYLGEGPAEPLPGGVEAVDWRVFLDLLEERGGSQAATRLFDRWVVTPQEEPLLDARRAARAAYRDLLLHGDGWAAPRPIREGLSTWDFDAATTLIAHAEEVLVQRDRIERLASAVGAAPSTTLEEAYEGARDRADLADATQLAGEQLETLAEILSAAESLSRDRDPLTSLGLLSEAPGAAIDEGRERYERDDLDGARASAQRAVELLDDAPARGRERGLILGIAAGLAVALLVTLGVRLGRRRHRTVGTMGPALPLSGEEPPSA